MLLKLNDLTPEVMQEIREKIETMFPGKEVEVMRLLTELNQDGTTVVMVTHNEHDAQIAHRVTNLFDGHIV